MDLKLKSQIKYMFLDDDDDDDELLQRENEFIDLHSQEQFKLNSKKNKKIQKQKKKRKSCNWGSGRPSKNKKIDSQDQQNKLQFIDSLSDLWFGTEISMQLIIYFCKMGNMIPKVVTGIPASQKNKDFMRYAKDKEASQNNNESLQQKKKYSNQLKRELKNKQAKLLAYLEYSEDTTYLFLGENKNCQEKLYLNYYISSQTKLGLEVVMKNLQPKFINTYKFIIQEYFQNKNISSEILLDNIVNYLIENKQNHKMIFDRQLIYELTKEDFHLINEIESNPQKADFHLYQHSSIRNLNFFSNTFNDEVEEITKKSFWIKYFLQGFIQILQSCDKQEQIQLTS